MKLITLTLLLAGTLLAKEVNIRVTVPDWVRYRTTAEDGTVSLWEKKPALFTTDSGVSFWYCDEGQRATIEGGALPKKWKRSIRRVH